MRLEVLGTNSAFVKDGVTNSFILWKDDDNGILLDCGYSVFQELLRKNYADKIKTILLSHQHQDHAGSAVTLLEYRYNVLHQKTAIGGAWDNLIRYADGADPQEMVCPLNIKCEAIEVPHAKNMACFALFVEDYLLYSGDSAISLLDTPQARKAKIIIHDISLSGGAIVNINELGKAPAEIKAKTYVSHYRPEDFEKISQLTQKLALAAPAEAGSGLTPR